MDVRTRFFVFFIFLSFTNLTFAEPSQLDVWEYTASNVPGQKFSSKSAAESAMKAVSVEASVMTQISTSEQGAYATYNYRAPSPVDAEPQSGWSYVNKRDNKCYSSAGEAVQGFLDLYDDFCPKSLPFVGSWTDSGTGLTSAIYASQCYPDYAEYKFQSGGIEAKFHKSKYNYASKTCGPITISAGLSILKFRRAACPTGYHVYRYQCTNTLTASVSGRLISCGFGRVKNPQTGACGVGPINLGWGGSTCSLVLDPINAFNGNSYQNEVDFRSNGLSKLSLRRAYNSLMIFTDPNGAKLFVDTSGPFGANWRSYYHRKLKFISFNDIRVQMPDGQERRFYLSYGQWRGDTGVFEKLIKTTDGYTFTTRDDIQENYDNAGKLISISTLNGYMQTLSYDLNGLLIEVSDNLGKAISFENDLNNRVSSVTDSLGEIYTYNYDLNNNLESVDYPDQTSKTYHYEDARWPNALTGITNRAGIREVNWAFDGRGRAVSNSRVGGVDGGTIAYNADGSSTVTDTRGNSTVYNFQTSRGKALVSSITGPGCTSCEPGTTAVYEYNSRYNRLTAKTVDGLRTEYGINYDNGEYTYIRKKEGTATLKYTSYNYNPQFRKKLSSVSDFSVANYRYKTTFYTRDAFGNPTQIRVMGYKPNYQYAFRITNLQYNGPLNQLSQIDGPRTDVSDITTLDYYPNDAAYGNHRARLKTVTSGGIVLRDGLWYNSSGKLLSETRPNGLTISYTYYPGNDRLETVSQFTAGGTRTTRWTYLPTGEVESITLGDGTAQPTTITLGYDAARRLTRITDASGNYIEYSLDTEGNRTGEAVYDNTGALQRALTQTYDLYNNLDTTSQANESATTIYKSDGTLDTQVDGNGTTSGYSYDALKRLISSTQDLGGTDTTTADALTQYGYDKQDNLTSVIDPTSGTTTYEYDDFGNLLKQVSPDTGTTTFGYDLAGNAITRTDAKGQSFSYTYDALNRVTFINAPYPLDDISYFYDTCSNGVGRLCSVTQGNEITNYSYNAFGDVTAHQGVQYAYDDKGQLSNMTYPSGNVLTVSYDINGQVNNLTLNVGGNLVTLASNINYAPFGPVTSLTYGNSLSLTQTLDSAYRLTNQSVPGVFERSYTQYDSNGNLQTVADGITAQNDNYAYDTLNRLISSDVLAISNDIDYDKNGNRIGLTNNNGAYNYLYKGNRLSSVEQSGLTTSSYTLDANGNTTRISSPGFVGPRTFTYNSHNRLVAIDANVAYTYNALGQRVSKDVDSNLTTYVYDTGGQLLGEYKNGTDETEHVYLNGQPIAVIKNGNVYTIHTDHLGTPRRITDVTQTVVWAWETTDPFGANAANDDPDGDGVAFEYNKRFAGQQYDAESGLHYNYFRYYDPSTGRYITSDPIGLQGGLNTYGYVGGNPLSWIDPLGLDAIPVVFPDYQIATPAGRIGGLGHAGILLINPDNGLTKYYEYGRYDSGEGQCGCGVVRQRTVPNVTMGSNGRPTQDSLNRVLGSISNQAGHGGRISGAYVQNNQFNAMNDYARQRMRQNNNAQRRRYSLTGNNCAHFAQDVLEAGGVDTPWFIDPRPTSYIDELRDDFPPIDFNPNR